MKEGYTHGPGQCRACFNGGKQILTLGDWRLHNNPGYYGSSAPEILILGFSKGANQNQVAKSGEFGRIAFAKARHRLTSVLETLKIMPTDRDIDYVLSGRETQFGTASLVRCSFCKMKEGKCKTSGDVIPTAFSNPSTLAIIERCASKFLSKLPPNVRLVVLLGTADAYINKTTKMFATMFSDYRPVNPAAFQAKGALWVYAAHPSPGNGHFDAWLSAGADNRSGQKRINALAAMNNYLALTVKLPSVSARMAKALP